MNIATFILLDNPVSNGYLWLAVASDFVRFLGFGYTPEPVTTNPMPYNGALK